MLHLNFTNKTPVKIACYVFLMDNVFLINFSSELPQTAATVNPEGAPFVQKREYLPYKE
jgi:hypothetical protein